ncbi:MAG: acyl-CoA dehydratase activase [Thermoleophilia bacterium]
MVAILGLDIGSRSVEAVWLQNGVVRETLVLESGFDAQDVCRQAIDRGGHDLVVATGYGRHEAVRKWGASSLTEIGAYARGARYVCPQAASVLDIGGQDTKVIILGPAGQVADFTMNDKCAAGSGRFLEVMAKALGYRLDEMANSSLAAPAAITISPMCTVFAESEAIGLLHRGEDRAAIGRGLHESIAARTLGMLKRTGAGGPLLFAGGVARNQTMTKLIADGFDGAVIVPETPEILGALGAALHGAELQDAKKEHPLILTSRVKGEKNGKR